MSTDLITNNDHPILSSSWTKYKVFKKIYSGGKVEYDHHSKVLFTLCDGCVLAIPIEKGPFSISAIGPYNQDETLGTEHSEEVVTFGYFNKNAGNRLILTIGSKGIFRLWKVIFIEQDQSGVLESVKFEYLKSWKSGQASIAEIEFDSTGQYVSSGSTDGTIQIFDVVGGFTTHNFKAHKSLITNMKFHSKRWLLFSTCVEGFISIYDLTSSKVIVQTNSHYSVIHSFDLFEINSTGNSLGGLVTSGADNMINIWDLDQIPSSDSIGMIDIASSSSEDTETNNNKKRKKESSLKTGKHSNCVELKPIKQIHSSETAFSVKCAPNELGNHEKKNCPWIILAGNEKSGVQVWNPIAGSSIKTLSPSSYSSNQSAVLYMFLDHQVDSPKIGGNTAPNRFLILVTEDRNIAILSYPSFNLFTTFFGNTPDYIQLALFVNKNIKSCESDPKDEIPTESISCVILDSTETPQIMSLNKYPYYRSPLVGHTSTVLTMDISKCSNLIATGSKDETIRVWSTYNNQECLAVLSGHTSLVTAVCFQKKAFLHGNSSFYLFSASNDNTLKAWNLASIMPRNSEESPKKSRNPGKKPLIAIQNVVAHKKEINHLSISHNDKLIATCSEDKTIKIWSFPDLKLQGTCKGHLSGVWQSSFSPIEKIIVSSSSDCTIKVWNLNTFQCTRTLQGHDGSVLQVDFLGNGIQLLSCGSDNLIKLWNLSTGECIKSFSGHDDRIWTLNLLRESNSIPSLVNSDKNNQKADISPSSNNILGNNPCGLQTTKFMATGGSDSQLILWMDNTKQVEDEENAKNLKRIEDLNEIDMLFNRKEYLSALNLSIRQKLQYKTYLILEKLLKPCFSHYKSFNHVKSIVEWIENLDTQELSTLFGFMLEWITISKTVWISNFLMYLILTNIEPQKLYKVEGFLQIVQAFRSYNVKVQTHLSTLYQKSYILDYLFLSNQISPSKSNPDNRGRISGPNESPSQEEVLGITLDTLFKS